MMVILFLNCVDLGLGCVFGIDMMIVSVLRWD